MGSTIYSGGTFYNVWAWVVTGCCGREKRKKREEFAEIIRQQQEDARYKKWREKLISQLSPILGDDEKARKSLLYFLEEQKLLCMATWGGFQQMSLTV